MKTNDLNHNWQNAFSPLLSDFCHPLHSLYSHQIKNESIFQDRSLGTIFLKDGTLGLIPLLSRLIKNNNESVNKIVLPITMAPLIPTFLLNTISFYKYESIQTTQATSFAKTILFLGSLSPHTSLKILEKYLNLIKQNTEEIYILRQNYDERSYKLLTQDQLDIMTVFDSYEIIKQILPNAKIHLVSPDLLSSLNWSECQYLNTNHYNYVCSNDYLTYLYFFKTGRTSLNFTRDFSVAFTKTENIFLIRNLSAQCYTYTGKQIIDENHLSFLMNLCPPEIHNGLRLNGYYSQDIQFMAKEFAEILFQNNYGAINV